MPKFLFDLLPILLFFAAFKFLDVFHATAVAIAVTVAQIAWLKYRRQPVEPMQWISLAVIVIFGGLTLWLHDETFIKWKPTILYWLFAGSLLGGRLLGRNLIRQLMAAQMTLPDAVWNRLNWMWTAFFTAMGAVNLWVAYHWSTDGWVNFKLFGSTGLTLAFVVLQAVIVSRHVDLHDTRSTIAGAADRPDADPDQDARPVVPAPHPPETRP